MRDIFGILQSELAIPASHRLYPGSPKSWTPSSPISPLPVRPVGYTHHALHHRRAGSGQTGDLVVAHRFPAPSTGAGRVPSLSATDALLSRPSRSEYPHLADSRIHRGDSARPASKPSNAFEPITAIFSWQPIIAAPIITAGDDHHAPVVQRTGETIGDGSERGAPRHRGALRVHRPQGAGEPHPVALLDDPRRLPAADDRDAARAHEPGEPRGSGAGDRRRGGRRAGAGWRSRIE